MRLSTTANNWNIQAAMMTLSRKLLSSSYCWPWTFVTGRNSSFCILIRVSTVNLNIRTKTFISNGIHTNPVISIIIRLVYKTCLRKDGWCLLFWSSSVMSFLDIEKKKQSYFINKHSTLTQSEPWSWCDCNSEWIQESSGTNLNNFIRERILIPPNKILLPIQ